MNSDPIAVARLFVGAVTEDRPPSSRELLKLLDALASAYHQTPDGDPSDTDPPEGIEYQERCALLRKRFPSYGYYASGDPTEPINEEPLVGDAIDDLADIWSDLEKVIWRFDNNGPDDAHWYYRFLFEIHWGMHVRQLSVYLHANGLRTSAGD